MMSPDVGNVIHVTVLGQWKNVCSFNIKIFCLLLMRKGCMDYQYYAPAICFVLASVQHFCLLSNMHLCRLTSSLESITDHVASKNFNYATNETHSRENYRCVKDIFQLRPLLIIKCLSCQVPAVNRWREASSSPVISNFNHRTVALNHLSATLPEVPTNDDFPRSLCFPPAGEHVHVARPFVSRSQAFFSQSVSSLVIIRQNKGRLIDARSNSKTTGRTRLQMQSLVKIFVCSFYVLRCYKQFFTSSPQTHSVTLNLSNPQIYILNSSGNLQVL